MRRIDTIAAVLTTAAVAVPVASAGNGVASANTQVTRQIVGTHVANTHRVHTAVLLQRHQVQVAYAKRWALLRARIR